MPDPRLDQIVTALLREQDGEHGLPQRLCEACLEALPVNATALTLSTAEGTHLVLAATEERARGLAELEFTLGEGPAVDASRHGGPVLVGNLGDSEATSRWPVYSRQVSAVGMRSQFSFPLQIGAIRLGVLTLLCEWTGPLVDGDLAEALTFAEAATTVLLHLQDVPGVDGALPAEIGARFEMTAEVHQATGIVSVQAAVGMTEALLLLRARAFGSDRTALAVARDVVAGVLRFGNDEDHHGDGQEWEG
jgi:hypothetical protein